MLFARRVLSFLVPLAVLITSMGLGTAVGAPSEASPMKLLVDAVGTPALSLDPHFSNSTITREIDAHVFDELVAYNEHFVISPDLAVSWKGSRGNHVWTFKLAKGVKFSNGQGLTSADVVASMNRYIKYGVGGGPFKSVTDISAPDKYTVKFTLSDSEPNFVINLANPLTLPAILPKSEAASTTALNPPDLIGTGPYVINKWIPDQYTELKINKHYTPPTTKKASGLTGDRKASIQTVRFDVVPVDTNRLNGATQGTYQYAEALPYAAYPTLQHSSGVKPYVIDGAAKPVFQINKWGPPMNNIWMRRALLASLDMSAILKFITHNNKHFYRLDSSMFFPLQKQWYYPQAGKGLYNTPNKKVVQADLKKAGYHGQEIEMSANEQYFYMYDEALAAQQQWQQNGINVKLNDMTWPAELALNLKHTGWDIGTSGYSMRLDPSFWSANLTITGSSSFGYDNPDMNKLFAQGLAAKTIKKRQSVYRKMQVLLWKQVPYIQIGDILNLDGGSKKLVGYRPWYIPRFWLVH